MRILLAVGFTGLFAIQSLWLFALSAHVSRAMETAAPLYLVLSIALLWRTYFKVRQAATGTKTWPLLATALGIFGFGMLLGAFAIYSAK